MAPMYQGPFSTTYSKDVARTFCKNKGLIFAVKGSYSNPFRFILGIDMIRISCFKREKEILLYSQTLPIKSTETFSSDDETMVNHLMYSLKSTKTAITDKDAFFRNIGVQFDQQWALLIVMHPLLMEMTNVKQNENDYKKMTVQQRLIHELGFDWLPHLDPKTFSRFKTYIMFTGSMIRLDIYDLQRDPNLQSLKDSISNYLFMLSVDGISNEVEYRFHSFSDFQIPIKSQTPDLDATEHVITLLVKHDDN